MDSKKSFTPFVDVDLFPKKNKKRKVSSGIGSTSTTDSIKNLGPLGLEKG